MKPVYLYVIGGLILLLAVWYFFFRTSTTTPAATTTAAAADLGVTKTGKTITESMLKTEMDITRGYNSAVVQSKATAAGVTFNEQLRGEALWMLQNADAH